MCEKAVAGRTTGSLDRWMKSRFEATKRVFTDAKTNVEVPRLGAEGRLRSPKAEALKRREMHHHQATSGVRTVYGSEVLLFFA